MILNLTVFDYEPIVRKNHIKINFYEVKNKLGTRAEKKQNIFGIHFVTAINRLTKNLNRHYFQIRFTSWFFFYFSFILSETDYFIENKICGVEIAL